MAEIYYEDLPLHRPTGLARVSEGLYNETVATVMAVIGPCSDEHAMRVVDAVLGPLKLVSPPPEMLKSGNPCGYMRFTYEGVWHVCIEDHEGEDEPLLHGNDETSWFASEADDRSFAPKPKA